MDKLWAYLSPICFVIQSQKVTFWLLLICIESFVQVKRGVVKKWLKSKGTTLLQECLYKGMRWWSYITQHHITTLCIATILIAFSDYKELIGNVIKGFLHTKSLAILPLCVKTLCDCHALVEVFCVYLHLFGQARVWHGFLYVVCWYWDCSLVGCFS